MGIKFNEQNKTFYINGKSFTYAFRVNKSGFLQHLYYGKKIAEDDLEHTIYRRIRGHAANNPFTDREESFDEISCEFPMYGRSDFREGVFAFDADGVRVCDFIYDSYALLEEKPRNIGMPTLRGGTTLCVVLKEKLHGITVKLYYSIYDGFDALVRRMDVINDGAKEITVDRAYSFSADLPRKSYQLITLPGAHLRERQICRRDIVQGIFTADSKYGVSSAQMNPFVAVVAKNTDENHGDAYGFNLIYSGNFTLKTELGQAGTVRVLGGINDFDFAWALGTGECFSTPEAVLVYSADGLGGMSRTFHDLYRDYLMPPTFTKQSRPVVLNNWEGTYFDFDEEKLCNIIRSASGTGINMFVLDDGWFGERNGETAGLGDWFINMNKLPNGFKNIISCAHENGMKFGLWFEPEMVDADSDLYRAHPDWAIHVDGLRPCEGRFQYVLDYTRADVRDYIVEAMSKVLNENEIDYVKWDMNRAITENYSAALGKNGKEFSHRYVLGLYDVLTKITTRFPNLFIEGCSSGGCRFDPAMLYFSPQIWTSDNSDAYARTAIQYGTSLCYPISAMSCHVSASPNHQTGRITSLESRTAIAHLGATGYELDSTKLSADELTHIKKDIDDYREIEDLMLVGDLYRLNDPLQENLFAQIVVSKDKSRALITVMLPLNVGNGLPTYIYPEGLDEDAVYSIRELGITLCGKTIQNAGIRVDFPYSDFGTAVFHLEKIAE